MSRTVIYSADPQLTWHAVSRAWELNEGFNVTWSGYKSTPIRFRVRAGFITDLASIPRVFRSIIPQVGRHIQPAITHDWAYESKTILTRAESDLLFLDGMRAVGVSWLRRRAMYAAVRAFGGTLWD
ncbi:hypothetical protein LCGC14_3128650 [marine sediment metagenome]|uniref:DUF1353 domain-containing protein n=1 Tax=marine sediment metagenome TaxID=412755 RepID=A0A0F8YPS6_9ZZZZ